VGKSSPQPTARPSRVWQYCAIPLQKLGTAVPICTNLCPGQDIVVDTSQPGGFVLSFSVAGGTDPQPPERYSDFRNPPYVTNAPSISLRILPNDENFSQYYVNPTAPEPVGNEELTFKVLYEKVLRTYYLLYPVMIRFVALNSEDSVKKNGSHPQDHRSGGLDEKEIHAADSRFVRQSRPAAPSILPKALKEQQAGDS
jgi:hypothetical protein